MTYTRELKPGERVTMSGFPGAIVRRYSEGMYEVRLASGTGCYCISDLELLDTKGKK